MLHMGLTQPLESDVLDHLQQANDRRLQAGRKRRYLGIDRIEGLNGPSHIRYISYVL